MGRLSSRALGAFEVDDIDAHFDLATQAALQLATQKEAAGLRGIPGRLRANE
jgi:hypothetical protein